jgi:hypothetical protein
MKEAPNHKYWISEFIKAGSVKQDDHEQTYSLHPTTIQY